MGFSTPLKTMSYQNLEILKTAKEISILDRAKYLWADSDVHIPDDAQVTIASHGYWVQAEVFVYED